MKSKPLYIFDLDGTLALIDHRRYLISNKKNPRWDEFYYACVDDKPNEPVIKIFKSLAGEEFRQDNEFFIFSGRSDLVKQETIKWLDKYLQYSEIDCNSSVSIKMRKHGDCTPDEILKRQWYEELSQNDKERLVCVFDDRQKVVDMWRSIGVTCLQVAAGDF